MIMIPSHADTGNSRGTKAMAEEVLGTGSKGVRAYTGLFRGQHAIWAAIGADRTKTLAPPLENTAFKVPWEN
jgi:hypothetical protein